MYSIFEKHKHPEYGKALIIQTVSKGRYQNPLDVYEVIVCLRKALKKSYSKSFRIVLDGKVKSIKSLEKWATEEYEKLQKCKECFQIITGNIYTNQFSNNNVFCSADCAIKNETYQKERLSYDEECDGW
jgi:phosphorylcholine metabolism protein LicD